ncbi:RNase P modulator RnpM [Dehalogenimonas etheniformans]|uniref:DUF448 domain-containing protein n=1 Tax=Dehalogenimonas etheniformans TaxID=1536648 RepID=A0A2P5P8W1_9CHLR|nr:YlxR family protein [Dehalogenimonas etheniformans]PPD58715.1 DUF448 domain-containing protein [Dehalogenimonas etheniformans]QNT76518.1 YlxR family protein [Dehalogenimonas etheniformans]
MNTTKKTPQRTCVVCRTVGSKRGLLRVVRTPEGQVLLDPSGRLAGRGAYLCREASCLNLALKDNKIEHILKVKISPEDRELLKTNIGEYIKEQALV